MKAIIYVVDALRADHLSCYGYERNTSPNIDNLCDDGIKISQASSNATWTRASAGAILSGLYPPATGVVQFDDYFPTDLPTLPDQLPRDITTFGISAMGNVSSIFGMDNYFDEFLDLYKHQDLLTKKEVSTENKLFQQADDHGSIVNPTSFDINDYVIPWVRDHQNEDFLIFIWSIDPHDPYQPMENFRNYSSNQRYDRKATYSKLSGADNPEEVQWIKDRYDDLIRQNDHAIGELIQFIKDIGIYDETLLGITGDHGEAFGEHGFYGHATAPYQEVTQVPLILKLPHSRVLDGQPSQIASHVDIAPTVLDIYNMEGNFSEEAHGQSLFSSKYNPEYITYTHLRPSHPTFASLFNYNRELKYIRIVPPSLREVINGGLSISGLYSWASYQIDNFPASADKLLYPIDGTVPNEDNSISDTYPQEMNEMDDKLAAILEDCKTFNQTNGQRSETIDDVTREQLDRMGYLE